MKEQLDQLESVLLRLASAYSELKEENRQLKEKTNELQGENQQLQAYIAEKETAFNEQLQKESEVKGRIEQLVARLQSGLDAAQ